MGQGISKVSVHFGNASFFNTSTCSILYPETQMVNQVDICWFLFAYFVPGGFDTDLLAQQPGVSAGDAAPYDVI